MNKQSFVKRSRSGEAMTISVLISSELDDLFCGEEPTEGYYEGKNEESKLKTS